MGPLVVPRRLHMLLKEKDPSNRFSDLVRVQNQGAEFLLVHPGSPKSLELTSAPSEPRCRHWIM